jgi:hypothetical protein
MSQGRTKWNFISHPAKPCLESLEVNYWKSLLNKLIKVGAELEFNLPTAKGLCKNDNPGCGCTSLVDNDCWMACLNTDNCTTLYRDIDHCKNKKAVCIPDKCATCANFRFNCLSLSCSHYIPVCLDCGDYFINCEGCKFLNDPEKDPELIRESLKGLFLPNNCYGTINKSGVHSVKTDGSLLGGKGAEVITIGRRVDFWEFYKMFKNIIDNSTRYGAYVNERCSIHMHILTSYYENSVESQTIKSIPNSINELEKPMPEIILTNFHQLMRKYQNAITWMAMGLDNPEHLTRWEKYRVSVLEISPLLASMKQVAETVKRSSNNSKYGFIDYRFCTFDSSGYIKRFHAEIRALDALLCPSALAAFACLYHALLIKAVEISRWGVLEMDSEWLINARNMKSAILNGTGGWDDTRLSNTKQVNKYKEFFVNESTDLIQQLKHILLQTGPAYETLEKIAQEPIAFKRLRGLDWNAIEEEIKPAESSNESDLSRFVDEAIDLRLLKRCENTDAWALNLSNVAQQEGIIEEPFEKIVEDIKVIILNKFQNGDAIWSNSIGTVVSIA